MADLYWPGASLRNCRAAPARLSIVLYILAIIVCAGAGAVVGWATAASLGLTGTPMALRRGVHRHGLGDGPVGRLRRLLFPTQR